jgi:hypothetical protein
VSCPRRGSAAAIRIPFEKHLINFATEGHDARQIAKNKTEL